MKKVINSIILFVLAILNFVFLSIPIYSTGMKGVAQATSVPNGWDLLKTEAPKEMTIKGLELFKAFAIISMIVAVLMVILGVLLLLQNFNVLKLKFDLNIVAKIMLIVYLVVAVVMLIAAIILAKSNIPEAAAAMGAYGKVEAGTILAVVFSALGAIAPFILDIIFKKKAK